MARGIVVQVVVQGFFDAPRQRPKKHSLRCMIAPDGAAIHTLTHPTINQTENLANNQAEYLTDKHPSLSRHQRPAIPRLLLLRKSDSCSFSSELMAARQPSNKLRRPASLSRPEERPSTTWAAVASDNSRRRGCTETSRKATAIDLQCAPIELKVQGSRNMEGDKFFVY